jgi:4-aminobutyrate aminotransferase-like enzyme
MDRVTQLDSRTADLVTRRRGLLGPGLKLFYERPLELVSGRGTSLFDAAGNRFLDAYNNVPSIGHCHPRLIETIRAQASALNTNTRYLSEPILEYAERLLASHSGELTRVIFTSSGSEAVDVALRIAWHATGRLGLIVTENAYHGVTAATAAISPSLGQGSPIHPYVRTVPPPFAGDGANSRAPDAFAADLSRAVEELGGDGFGVAAIVLDSVFASDGLITEPLGLLKGAQELAHSVGALIITDEVQAGFGRTGEAMWGYQRHGVSPDLVPMGKPMGGGMPVGGVAGRSGLIDAFASDVGFFSTFGGSSVPIAAARTVLEVIEEEGLVDNAGAVGGHLGRGLRTLASQSLPSALSTR